MKFPTENPRKPGNMDPPPVAVQTNLVPPKKVQPGMLQSSLVHASVATMQNPMGCTLPRLSVSSRPPSVVASMEAVADGSAPFTMMKLKTVLAVFVVVVAYLVAGGLVFRALEQPFENNQKITITAEKAAFLQKHPCVSPDELEAVIKAKLKGHRHDQLKRKLPSKAQWLNAVEEDKVMHTPPHYNMPFDGRGPFGPTYTHTPPYAHMPPLQSYFPNSAPIQQSFPPNSSAADRTQNAVPLSTVNTSDLTHTPVEGMRQFSYTQTLMEDK